MRTRTRRHSDVVWRRWACLFGQSIRQQLFFKYTLGDWLSHEQAIISTPRFNKKHRTNGSIRLNKSFRKTRWIFNQQLGCYRHDRQTYWTNSRKLYVDTKTFENAIISVSPTTHQIRHVSKCSTVLRTVPTITTAASASYAQPLRRRCTVADCGAGPQSTSPALPG